MTNVARAGTVYYGKYIVDIIGEFTVGAAGIANIREWPVPVAQLTTNGNGIVQGITYGLQQPIWFALQRGHRLVELDPATGLFTAYGGNAANGYPIPYPIDVAADNEGNIWFTGSGTTGALVGALHTGSGFVTYWDLPIACLSPFAIWAEADGSAVWFTVNNSSATGTGAYLGRLRPFTNTLDYWSTAGATRPVGQGITGWPATGTTDIWFGTWSADAVYRLDVSLGTFTEYLRTSASGYPIALTSDRLGNCWIGSYFSRLSEIAVGCHGAPVAFNQTTVAVKGTVMPTIRARQKVVPRVSNVPATPIVPTSAKDHCYNDIVLPSPPRFQVGGVALTPGPNGSGPPVYFSEAEGYRIGCFTPP